jgi:hypothetical protein
MDRQYPEGRGWESWAADRGDEAAPSKKGDAMGKRTLAATLFMVALLSVTAGAVVFQQVGSGMLGYWTCDDTAAPTIDSSGNGNNGTWSAGVSALTGAANTPQATPFSTGCLNFNATTAQVSVPGNAQLTLTGDFTVAFWMYPTADAGDWQRLVGKGSGADPASAVNRTFGVWREPGGGHHILFQQYNNGSAVINITTSLAGPANNGLTPNNAWTHVAARISGTAATVFLNGVQGASGTRSGTPSAVVTDPLTFAYAGFHTSFPGNLDDIRLYDHALSDADILSLAQGSQGPAAPVLSGNYGAASTMLSWTGTATVFNVKRSSTPGGPYTTIASNVAGSTYTDNATGYYYVVSGVTFGEGPNSNEVAPPVVALPNTGLQTTESGGTASFQVTFNAPAPAAGSTLTITSSNSAAGLVSSPTDPTPSPTISIGVAPGFVGYIPITVTGVDDFIVTPNQAYTVSVAASNIAAPIPNVQLTNLETDTLGILVSKNIVVTNTDGAQDSFSVQLNSMPTSAVSIAVTSSNTSEATVSPAILTFTGATWNVPQTVTVTGVGVNLTYITEYYSISLVVQAGSDPAYVGLTGPPSGSPVLVSGSNLHLEIPPALPKVWGGSSGGGCGLLGLEIALPLFLLRRRRPRR